MQPPHGSLLCRKRDIVLHGKFMDAVLREFLATPHPGKEPSFVVEELRLQNEAATDRTGNEFYADAFLGTEREFAKLAICLVVKARTSSPFACALYHSIVAAKPFCNPQTGAHPNRVLAFVESSFNRPASWGPLECSEDQLAPSPHNLAARSVTERTASWSDSSGPKFHASATFEPGSHRRSANCRYPCSGSSTCCH